MLINSFLTHFLANTSPGVITYFNQSNFSGKLIVLALIAFSLIAWTVMIGKYLELKKFSEQNTLVNALFQKNHSIASMKNSNAPFARLINSITEIYSTFQIQDDLKKNKSILQTQVENALQRELAKEAAAYESKMTMLGSILSGAPFLGLLGTVWGVMDAFGSMALQSSMTLQSLAPGVSGALLTTVAALLVAIPSVFGYNFLASKTKRMVIELENFASGLMDQIELELNK